MNRLWTGLLLVAAWSLAAWPPAAPAKDKPAPGFTLKDQDGKPVGLKDHAGKIVVLEWVNWECPFYRRHIDAGTTKKLARKYADAGVVWLGVNSTKHHNVEKIKAWHAKAKIPYRVLDDHTGEVGRAYGARTTPHMIVLDKKHRVAYDGAIDDDRTGRKLKEGTARNYVGQALGELVAGKAPSVPKTKPYGCSVKYAPAPPPSAGGKKAPPVTLKDQDGKDVSLADFAGKTVVLEWINPDCPFSLRHYKAKTMVDLAGKYRDKGGVWLAVNTTHYWTQAKNKDFAGKYGVPYPILDDHTGEVGRKYGAKTTPDMRIIDAKGYLIYSGAIDDDSSGKKLKAGTAKNHVDAILAKVAAGKPVLPTQTKPYGCSVKYAKTK